MAARAHLERAAVPALLAGTALLYLWHLGDSGWANTYYSAAAQAGSESWEAFLLGCSDAACASTVDKPPLSVWPMALSIRVFGLSSWSVLVPQAVIGVLTVWALVATVRRTTGSAGAALLSGLVLALTPVAALMFRFNNPDALLTLLLVLAAASVLRAVEPEARNPARWVLLAGALVGIAFLVKLLQAFLVLPALGLVYLVAAAAPFWRRIVHLLAGFAVTLAVAGSWVLLVATWPASTRPYLGSTQDNSILELVGGYNGVGRLTGDMSGTSVDFSKEVGPLRMLNGEVGGQIAWLLPTALLLLVAVLWLRRREPRADQVRSGAVLWGTWALVSIAVFSAMAGVFHAYYTVSLAPAVAALVGIGAHQVAGHRVLGALAGAVTVATGWVLLERSIDFLPWLPWAVLAVGVVAVVLLLAGRTPRLALAATLLAGLAGPAAYAVDTTRTPHTGAVPLAGPFTEGGRGAAVQPGRRLPAGQRRAGHGGGRVQRQRPVPDAAAVPRVGAPGAGALLHPGRARQQRGRGLGGGDVRRRDDRRRPGLRPRLIGSSQTEHAEPSASSLTVVLMSLATDERPSMLPATPAATGQPPRARRPIDWGRPALAVLLLGTGVLYLWSLGESGWANSFYSAAAQAGSDSWKAFFFGSSDAANSITVDKAPLSLWPMALSVKIFGLSSWSLLVPQALMGVGTVWLLHGTVRRTTGSAVAGLLAGLAMALTPVAVLMFRFNNPDALLTLLMVGAAAATLRAAEAPGTSGSAHPIRWLSLAGTLVGLAFLTKMLQAFLVVPALGLAYLLVASAPLLKRFGHLLVGLAAMIASAGWWVAIVSLWPASSRPYIGGSQDNSILELTLGYNGFGRLTGDEVGSVGGGGNAGGGTGMWGATGVGRLLNSEIGGQIGWLLPTSLLLLVAGLWLTRRAPRTDRVRAGLILWGTWLLVTAATFSFMAGIFHAYYTVALAPAIAAIVGIGAWLLWQHRTSLFASFFASAAVALTTVLAFFLLGRTEDFVPWLRWAVLPVGIATSLLVAGLGRMPQRFAAGIAALAVVASLAGPAAYAVETAATPHTGSIPTAGPSTGGFGGGFGGGPGGGGAGGLLDGSTSSAEMTALLQADADSYTWVAAAVGSNTAAGYQLASEEPVMAIGGFNGSDPSPTLAEFQEYVADGAIHYFIGGGGFGGQRGGSESSSDIATWVAANFTEVTVGDTIVYDLTDPA